MPVLTIIVNNDKGQPVNNASIYLFEGAGGIETKENAVFNGATGADGKKAFEVSGFYRVGIYIKDYITTDSTHTVPDEWKNIWTCWGAAGVGSNDMDYQFNVKLINQPTSPIIWVVAGIGIIAVVAMGVLMVYRRSKKK
jgi:hypothetical protein